MALGVDFLSKTKIGGMKDIMSNTKTNAGQGSSSVGSLFNSVPKQQKAESKPDVANMDSSSLLKYVYENGFDNNQIKLPATVEFDGQEFPTHGQKFDTVVRDICLQTGQGKTTVEAELKKNLDDYNLIFIDESINSKKSSSTFVSFFSMSLL